MRTCIRTELYKAFSNKMLYIAIGIGLLISGINIIQSIINVQEYTERLLHNIAEGRAISSSYAGFSLFINWISTNLIRFSHGLFFFIWPALAAMPYSWSYSAESRNGYYNQIVVRSNAKTYFISKYIAVFVSGGFAIAVPLLFDLLANALISPYCIPDITLSIEPITNSCFLSGLYYTHPWLFAFIWCFVDFLWGGVAACTCFVVGAKIRLQVIVTLIPFVVFTLLDGLNKLLHRLTQITQTLSPINLAQPITMFSNPGWAIFSIMGALFVFSVFAGYQQVVKHELV